MTQNISIRLTPETVQQIDSLAKSQDRSRNWWINQAIENALAEEQAWIDQVEQGLKAANEGEFASYEEVEAVFQRFKSSVNKPSA